MTSLKIRRAKLNNVLISANRCGRFVVVWGVNANYELILVTSPPEGGVRGGTTRRENTTNVIFKSEAFGDPAFCKSSKRYDKLDSRATHENDKRISPPDGGARGGTTRREKTTNVIFKSEAFGDPAFWKVENCFKIKKLDSRAPHENDKGTSPPEGGARGGTTRRETIISSPTGEGATHVNIFQNYCKITKYKCVARWGLARRGGALC